MLDILNKTLILTALLLFSITSCTIEEKGNSNLAPQEEGFVSLDITSILQDYNSDATKAGFVEPGYKLTYESEKIIKNLYVFIFDNKDTLESIAFYDSTVIGKIAINGKINLPDKIRVQASEKKTICIVGNASKQTRYYLEDDKNYKMVIGKSKLKDLRDNYFSISDYTDDWPQSNKDKFAASLKPLMFFANEEPSLLLPMYGELEFRAMRENKNTEELKITVPLKRSLTRLDILLCKDVNNNNEYIIDSLTNLYAYLHYGGHLGYTSYSKYSHYSIGWGWYEINKTWIEESKTIITNGVGTSDEEKRIFSIYVIDPSLLLRGDYLQIKNIFKEGEGRKNLVIPIYKSYTFKQNTVYLVDCTLHTNDSISVNLKSGNWEDVELPLGLHRDGAFTGPDEIEYYATWPDEKCKLLKEYSDEAYRKYVVNNIGARNKRDYIFSNYGDTLSFIEIKYKGKKIEPFTDSLTYAPGHVAYYAYHSQGYYYRLFYDIFKLEDSIYVAYCSNDSYAKVYKTKKDGHRTREEQLADSVVSVTTHYNILNSRYAGDTWISSGITGSMYDILPKHTVIAIIFDRYEFKSLGITVYPSDSFFDDREKRRSVQEDIEFTFKIRADNINKNIKFKVLPFSRALVDLKPIYEEWVDNKW